MIKARLERIEERMAIQITDVGESLNQKITAALAVTTKKQSMRI